MTADNPIDCTVTFGALADIGKRRSYNQDEVICCPEHGFFAVCDGMGGLPGGGDASRMVSSVLPGVIAQAKQDLSASVSAESVAAILKSYISTVSNNIYDTANQNGIIFGSTLCGVWLVNDMAVFVNIGDSRAYLLPKYKRQLRQISQDHNAAALLVAEGEITKSQAVNHPSSSRLTRFLGMPSPAVPQTFIERVAPGDRILLCSDGLYGMVPEPNIKRIMRSSKSADRVCKRLINAANEGGGRDNISAVYLRIS